MAEASARTDPAAAAVMIPGRHGFADGVPGIIVQERRAAGFALLTARSGQRAGLEGTLLAAFGVALPAAGKRRAGDPLASERLALTGIGPDRWLAEVFAQPSDGIETFLRAASGTFASVVELSDANIIVRVHGARVRDVLATGLPIDLHPGAFAVDDAAQTLCAHIGVLVWRIAGDPAGGAVFEIATPRSSFGSFWHWLEASGLRHGLEVRPARTD